MVFAPWCFEGSLEGDKMPQLHENHALILDKVRPHHARKVREYLADHPIWIPFLPSNSPQMNSIETCGRRSSSSGDNDGFGAFLNSKPRSEPTYSRSLRRAEKRLWPVVAIAQF